MPLKFHGVVGDFLPAFTFADKLLPIKSMAPVLGHVLVKAEADALLISSTDLDHFATASVKAEVLERGAVTANSVLVSWLRRHNKRHAITFTFDRNELLAKVGASSIRVRTLPASDFPAPFPDDATIATFALTESECAHLFQGAPIIPDANARRALLDLSLRCVGGKLLSVACDGTRLIEASIDATPDAADFSIIVARNTAVDVAAMKNGVTIRVGAKHIEIQSGNHALAARLWDGEFPSYRQAIPPASVNTAEVDRATLLNALDLVHIAIGRPVQNGKPQPGFVALKWGDNIDDLTVAASKSDVAEAIIPAAVRGFGTVTAALSQIIPLLGAIDADSVVLDVAGPGSPIRITKPDSSNFVAVQMPVRP